MISIYEYPKLFLCLDSTLRNVFTVLSFLSNEKADNDGWFSATNKELLALTKISVNPTIAALETLYRANLLDIVVSSFTTNGRNANQYRLKVENFNNEFATLETLNYHNTDYQVTYNLKKASLSVQNNVALTTVRPIEENATVTKEIALNQTLAPQIEVRNYTTPSERLKKVVKNAETLIEKMKRVNEWNRYQEMMTKYEDWLNKCFQTLDDDALKHQLLKKAQHVMDEIVFIDDTPKTIIDTPKVVKSEKTYTYKGSEAEDQVMTLKQCKEKGYNVYMLWDWEKKHYYSPYN